ncbi:MAG: NusG domain II-containing protein [Eubacteriales bacterium]|nr:NusG domain II-containing protein [Eubacteriales bacterium]
MKRNDIIILAVIVAAGVILFFASGRGLPGGENAGGHGYLRVVVQGEEQQRVALTESREITIDQDDGGHNVVEIFPGGFRMKEANCKNQDCVHQSEVTLSSMGERALYNQVVCLPNKVVLELVTEDVETLEITP